ncbi:hypothetical protein [Dyadobacter bucti]|uniref:hypothetical protein n=1 Tax=Dyadobacter bucti TaxID=2572203 RepID=UPI001108C0CB|nr:hypothetical protein [Dyadobacter bucti]
MLKKHIPLRINFRPKKQVKGNNAFIYCRIKLNGVDATDFSTHIRHTDHWDQASQHFNCKEYQFENDQLSEIIDDIKLIYKELKRSKDDITAHHLRNTYCRRSEKRTLLNCYDHHLTVFSKRLGAEATMAERGRATRAWIVLSGIILPTSNEKISTSLKSAWRLGKGLSASKG